MEEVVRLSDDEFRVQQGREILFKANLGDLTRWVKAQAKYIYIGSVLTGEELIEALNRQPATPIAIPTPSRVGRSVD